MCECGVCICESPYFGDYCDLCSGDDVCQTGTCDVEGESHLCAECAVDLLEALNNASSTDELQLFTDEGLMIAIYNLSLIPMDSVLTFLEIGEVNVSAIELPKDFVANCSAQVNGLCPGFFIVNEEELMDNMSYTIESKWRLNVPYSWKLSRAKTFMNWRKKEAFCGERFHRLPVGNVGWALLCENSWNNLFRRQQYVQRNS